MKDIAFHITDIVQNSVRAEATEIFLSILKDGDTLIVTIRDNGCGMDDQALKRVVNPFYTTRTTRKVGLGLPFLIQNAEQSGGSVEIHSEEGAGTEVRARFVTSNIDCPPAGAMASTLAQTITGNPTINITLNIANKQTDDELEISSSDIVEILEGVPLGHPKVSLLIEEMIAENLHL